MIRIVYVLCLLLLLPQYAISYPKNVKEICDQNCGHWKFYQRGQGGGKNDYDGTREISCHGSTEFWWLTGGQIKEYQCEKGFKNCKFTESQQIIETGANKDGHYYVTYGKNRNWMTFRLDEEFPKRCISTSLTRDSYTGGIDGTYKGPIEISPEGLIPPNYGGLQTTAEINEFNEPEHAAVSILHRVGKGPANDPCTAAGDYYADISLLYRKDHKVRMDYILNLGRFANDIGGERQPWFYEPEQLMGRDRINIVHCSNLDFPRGKGRIVQPRWYKPGTLYGTIYAPQVAARYEVRNSKVVKTTPLKACCYEDQQMCHGYVVWNQKCPKGRSFAGNLGNGKFTTCGICGSAPISVQEEKPQGAKKSVGCCFSNSCESVSSSLTCRKLGGTPLKPESPCPIGRNPCLAPPPPPPTPAPAPAPAMKPGACHLTNNGCVDVDSPSKCFAIKNHISFERGSRCSGGCCNPVGTCTIKRSKDCIGTFFRDGCPAVCPDQQGKCIKKCVSNQTELCKTVSGSKCALLGGDQFATGQICEVESANLQCPKGRCNFCPRVLGSWETRYGRYLFYDDCTGTVHSPEGIQERLQFSCNSNQDIDILYPDSNSSQRAVITGEEPFSQLQLR